MDIFVEQLVKKKRDSKDYLIILAGIIGALLVIYVLGALMFSIPLMGFIIFIVACGLIYLLYMLITSVNLEYEYCFTNGSFDVDAIVNVRKRKRLTEFNAREVEIMAKRSHPDFERYMNNQSYQKVYACVDKNSSELYFAVYNENGSGKMLLFNPNEKIRDGFKKFNPQKVALD